uniref:Inositol monophosphatase n=1 Tax=Ignisphaera aggregans TaxID=334771 RepID=A0A7J2U659_9CREN
MKTFLLFKNQKALCVIFMRLWREVLNCVESVRAYLRSSSVSYDVVGQNPFGDVSKSFDVEAERIVEKCLAQVLGEVAFLSEETGLLISKNPKWIAIIDPVDGSTNFAYEIPWASISLAIAPYKKGARVRDVELAIVAEVFRDVTYVYRDGLVEVLGGRQYSRRAQPAPIMLGYFENENSYKPLLKYASSHTKRLAIRSLGSAALDIVYVGLGNAEVFIDTRAKLRNVDVAAALRIATALGAKAIECSENLRDALDIEIDSEKRIGCLVATYNDEQLKKVLASL